MKKYIIVFGCLVIIECVHAQWYWQNPLPQGNNLNTVYFMNDDTGFVAGLNGVMLKTTNGGEDWNCQNLTSGGFMSLYFLDENLGYGVGVYGTIFKTIDGGVSWMDQSVSNDIHLRSVFFNDENNGFAVAWYGIVLQTTNGGDEWDTITVGTSKNLQSIYFRNDTLGFITGWDGLILKTTDGGAIWNTVPSGTNEKLLTIHFVDDSIAYISGDYGVLLKSSNGGSNWFVLNGDIGIDVPRIFFTSIDEGYAVGHYVGNSVITKTTNAGITWERYYTGTIGQLINLYFTNQDTGYVIGVTGFIFKTTDGGTSWISKVHGTTEILKSIFTIDGTNTSYTCGYNGTILKTTNNGNNWVELYSGSTTNFSSIYFINEDIGFVAGSNKIYKTTDGGSLWIEKPTGTIYGINSIFFPVLDTGYAVGYGGLIMKSINGGETWITLSSGTSSVLYGVHFIDKNHGTTVGESGIIIKTTNGGQNWSSQTSGVSVRLNAVSFSQDNLGVASGDNETILQTTNGGSNWIIRRNGGVGSLSSICCVAGFNNTKCYAVGGYNQISIILKSTDCGETWISLQSGANSKLYGVSFHDEDNGFVVGEGGSILRTMNGGIPVELTSFIYSVNGNKVFLNWTTVTEINNNGFEIERSNGNVFVSIGFVPGHGTTTETNSYSFEDNNLLPGSYSYRLKQIDFDGSFKYSETVEVRISVPVEFSLEQNFPNPFNPSTKIKYSIPQSSNVELKVYDVLGNEIETLVNEEKQTGTYEIAYYADNLPSGVYFYQLMAGSYIETKKMLLIK